MRNKIPLSPRLVILWSQSFSEAGISREKIPEANENESICLFPQSFIDFTKKIGFEKTIDFNFRGSLYIDSKTWENRKWIINFAKIHFTSSSFFQVTDKNAKSKIVFLKKRHKILGSYDYTFKKTGFVPKENPMGGRGYFDKEYFKILCRSKFTLCPAGDAPWSMRFYEAIFAKSIPIVEKIQHTGRNELEYNIGYKYFMASDNITNYRKDWVEENYNKFLKFQTLFYGIKREGLSPYLVSSQKTPGMDCPRSADRVSGK